MKLNFYFQLAKKNISTGAKTYIPYIFACSLSIMMFSIMYTLSKEAFRSPLKTPFKKDEKYVKKQNERKRII